MQIDRYTSGVAIRVLGITLQEDEKGCTNTTRLATRLAQHTIYIVLVCVGVRMHVPDDAPAAAVDGLRDEPHETYAAAAIHQVDASRHLHCIACVHDRPPPLRS